MALLTEHPNLFEKDILQQSDANTANTSQEKIISVEQRH